MYYDDIPYYTQDFHPDVIHGMVPDGLAGQPPYIDPIFDPDVIQEVSDVTQPDWPQNEEEVRDYTNTEDWMTVAPFWPQIPE
jgi:hypothetical protein